MALINPDPLKLNGPQVLLNESDVPLIVEPKALDEYLLKDPYGSIRYLASKYKLRHSIICGYTGGIPYIEVWIPGLGIDFWLLCKTMSGAKAMAAKKVHKKYCRLIKK